LTVTTKALAAAAVTSVCQENLANVQCVVDGGGVMALLRLLEQRDIRLAHTAALTLGFLCMQDAGVRSIVRQLSRLYFSVLSQTCSRVGVSLCARFIPVVAWNHWWPS
jgi:hypothetical protein